MMNTITYSELKKKMNWRKENREKILDEIAKGSMNPKGICKHEIMENLEIKEDNKTDLNVLLFEMKKKSIIVEGGLDICSSYEAVHPFWKPGKNFRRHKNKIMMNEESNKKTKRGRPKGTITKKKRKYNRGEITETTTKNFYGKYKNMPIEKLLERAEELEVINRIIKDKFKTLKARMKK